MPMLKRFAGLITVVVITAAAPALAQHEDHAPVTRARQNQTESASRHHHPAHAIEPPALPEGMSLDEVLDYAAGPPPKDFPPAIDDDQVFAFTLLEQLEYRIQDGGPDHLGWEAQGWIGYDFDKFWWKSEGEAGFEGVDAGESENDLLYSRLISPFWNVQVGVRYANEWESDKYSDTWSGVISLLGLAPGTFEVDSSLYLSEHGDVSLEIEAEYDIRLTQRLVLQPRMELALYAQDIPDENIGAGLSDVSIDLRLRYEIKREIAPYVGVRYQFLVGETDNLAAAAGEDTEQLFFLAGVRLAF